MTSARDDVLGRVRRALAVGGAPTSAAEQPITRTYRRASDHDPGTPELLDLLTERIEDYRAQVTRCRDDDTTIALAVEAALFHHEAGRVVIPPGLPEWVTHASTVRDDGTMDADALDQVDAVVTGCAVAIAETGTFVLDGGPWSGRRAITLVPDLHICVIRGEQVVGTVPEALARLDPTRPLTFVSGPSATSDIELDRVEGVHGPRTLHVVLAVQAL